MALDSDRYDLPLAAEDQTLPDQRRIAQLSAVLVRNLSIRDTRPDQASSAPSERPVDLHDDDPTRDRRLDCGRDSANGIQPLSGSRRVTAPQRPGGEDADQLGSPATATATATKPPRPSGAFRRSASAGTLLQRAPGSYKSSLRAHVGGTTTIAEEAPAANEASGTPGSARSELPRAGAASSSSNRGSSDTRLSAEERPRVRTRAQAEADRRRTALRERLVDSFVSLELLPAATSSRPDPARSDRSRTASTSGEAPALERRHVHGRSRSGSVRSLFARPDGNGSASSRAPGMSRSGSANSFHKVEANGASHVGPPSAFATSPRKTMRRRTTVSADFFAPLPSFPASPAKGFSASSVSTTTAEPAHSRIPPPHLPPPSPARPFFVSNLSKASTHATFFLDPDQITVPEPDSPMAGLPAFPEQVRDWPGWAEGRIRATVWARPTTLEEESWPNTRAGEYGTGKGKEKAIVDEDDWRVVAEWDVDLAGLTSLGRDPTEFPTLPPNTLVFALSSSGVVPQFPSDPSTSSAAAAADDLEYFTAPMPLLQRAHRRRLRAERRARMAVTSTRFDSAAGSSPLVLQQRSWSEDELSDYLEECCDDSDCSDCGDGAEFGEGVRSAVPFRGSDDEVGGGGGGYTSDPGMGGDGAVVRRARSDTIRSRRSGRSGGRRGTLVSHDPAHSSSTSGSRDPSSRQLRPSSRAPRTATIETAEEVRRHNRRKAQEVLEKSRRETRMVRAAEWEGMRRLCEARWELESVKRDVEERRGSVSREMGDEEEGWAAQDRLRAELHDRLEDLEGVKEAVDSELSEEQYELDIRRARLRQRRDRLERAQRLDQQHGEDLDKAQQELENASATHQELLGSAQTRRTQLITLLSHIFPIEPVFSAPKGISPDLLFSILGTPLPNSTFPSSYSDDAVSSALGYAAQVTQLIAAYLSVPLCYPITCCGSRSTVRDEISMMKGPRAFPLFGKGVDQYRFDYGVFLLNKNIEQLMYAQGLTVLDLRNTLPNLKTLILSLSYDPSHEDYLASTLLPTGPFTADEGDDDEQFSERHSAEDDSVAAEYLAPDSADLYDEEAERSTMVTTRSSRSTSNASTIRPSKLLVGTNGQRESSSAFPEVDASTPDQIDSTDPTVPPDFDSSSSSFPADAPPKVDATQRKSRRNGRRRSSSSASEKVTLVKTVQKAYGRSASGGSTGSSGSGHGGGGYGAKLREGLWSVVAGGTGRRESSAAAAENGSQASGPVEVE